MSISIPWLQKLLLKLIPEDNVPGVGIGPIRFTDDPFEEQAKVHDEMFALRESAVSADRAFFSLMLAHCSEVAKTSLTKSGFLVFRAIVYILVCRTVGTVLRWRLPPYE
jgi:hypothetical protein